MDGAAAGSRPALASEAGSRMSSSTAAGICCGEGVWMNRSRLGRGASSGLAAGGALAAPLSPRERIRWPTLILSPTFTKIWATVPAAVEGIVATAFSFSSSRMGWSLVIKSPSLTSKFTTVPESAPSPRCGSFKSIRQRSNVPQRCLTARKMFSRHRSSNQLRIRLFRVHAQVLDGSGHHGPFHLSLLRQCVQCCDHN